MIGDQDSDAGFGWIRLGLWSPSRLVHDGLAAWLTENRPTVRPVLVDTRSPQNVAVTVLLALGSGATPLHLRGVVHRFLQQGVPVIEVGSDNGKPRRLGNDYWVLPASSSLATAVDLAVRLAVRPVLEFGLTKREAEALLLYAHGLSARETAERLGIDHETVRTFLRRSRAKIREHGLEASSKEDLRQLVLQRGAAS